MVESFDHMKHLCIVLEALDMNLRETLNKFGKNIGLNLSIVRFYAKQLFVALHFLKKHRVVHADLKPDNIMVAKDSKHTKLADFGSALYADECGITEYLVSRYYRAPEIILGNQYGYPVDTWSAVVSLYELYTGKVMFPGNTNNDMLRLIMRVKGKFATRLLRKAQFASRHFDEQGKFLMQKFDPVTKQEYRIATPVYNEPAEDIMISLKAVNPQEDWKLLGQFKDFIERGLTLDPNKRMTPEEALEHPFLGLKLRRVAFVPVVLPSGR